MIDLSLVKAESNPVIDAGAKFIRDIDAENKFNTMFVAILAVIAVFAFYFLVKSPSKARNSNNGPVDGGEPEKFSKIVSKGAKWGFATGFLVAMVYIQRHKPSSLGFYPGDIGLVFAACLPSGAAIGALIGWLSALFWCDK